MPNFSDITVVTIHGNGKVEDSVPSMEKTIAALPGSRGLLITDQTVNSPIPQKLVHQKMRHEDYSPFVVYCLKDYIETEYCLIVQQDGWALNAANWRDEWFNYDYVGSPIFTGVEKNPVMGYKYDPINNCYFSPYIVQNGGFSLRSRKLLEAPTKYGITMKWDPVINYNNEDFQLTCAMRPALESVGIKFAPTEVARYFSVEHLDPRIHNGIDITEIFGQHCTMRKLLPNNVVQWYYTEEQTASIPYEVNLLNLLLHYGYTVMQYSPK